MSVYRSQLERAPRAPISIPLHLEDSLRAAIDEEHHVDNTVACLWNGTVGYAMGCIGRIPRDRAQDCATCHLRTEACSRRVALEGQVLRHVREGFRR